MTEYTAHLIVGQPLQGSVCADLPDRVKADPALMPFGVYVVGSDG